MAACHKLIQLFFHGRKVPTERLFSRFSRSSLQHTRTVSSLCIDYQRHAPLQHRWNSPLESRFRLSQHGSSRFLHTSPASFCQVKNSGQKKNIPGANKDGDKSTNGDTKDGNTVEDVPEEKLTVFQRFKKTYKEHGKILIVVHLITSSVWFGSFFFAAKVGVDVIPFMEWLGLSEKIINPFRSSSLGDVAIAYLMYKLATPARYTVTLGGTNLAIKYLRKKGVMQPVDKTSSLRSLARDSRQELSVKRAKIKVQTNKLENNLKERRTKVKERLTKFRSKLKNRRSKNGSKPRKRSYPWRK